MTKEEFVNDVYQAMKDKPQDWRKGQFVFNYIDKMYPDVARTSQFKYGVDCFYDDKKIESFLDQCYEIIETKV